jgi:hypothetical protein
MDMDSDRPPDFIFAQHLAASLGEKQNLTERSYRWWPPRLRTTICGVKCQFPPDRLVVHWRQFGFKAPPFEAKKHTSPFTETIHSRRIEFIRDGLI